MIEIIYNDFNHRLHHYGILSHSLLPAFQLKNLLYDGGMVTSHNDCDWMDTNLL